MFMSTRYKKKDPEWRKKWLFNVDDSLANLLECLSIEYRYCISASETYVIYYVNSGLFTLTIVSKSVSSMYVFLV